jgi:hypothetical protein
MAWKNSNQMNLFGLFEPHTRARPGDPDTSHAAARRIQHTMTDVQIQVLTYFRSIYPRAITDLDLQAYFSDDKSTYRTRRSELVAMGLIVDTLQRRFQDGSNRVLWVAVMKEPEHEGPHQEDVIE